MEENKVKTYRITLNFEAIDNWRDSERDDLPVHGMVSFYKAAGVIDFFKEHKEEFDNLTTVEEDIEWFLNMMEG